MNKANSVRKEASNHTERPEEKQRKPKGERGVAWHGHGEKREKLFIVPGTSYKNDQPIDRRRCGMRLALIGRVRRPNHHLHSPTRIHGMHRTRWRFIGLPQSPLPPLQPRTFFCVEKWHETRRENRRIVRPPCDFAWHASYVARAT